MLNFKLLHASYRTALPALFSLVLTSLLPEARLSGQLTQLSGAQTRIMTNVQSGKSYTILATDCGKLISFSNSSSVSVTIPQAGATGLSAGCWMDLQNLGPGAVTLTPVTSLIDQSTSVQLTANQGLRLVSSGASYLTQRGQGSGTIAGSGSIGGVNAQTANYTATSIDNGKLVTMNGINLTLLVPASPPTSTWAIFVQNVNPSDLTVSGNGNSINAAGNFTLKLAQAAWIFTDGANYFADPPVSCGFGTTCTFSGSGIAVNIDTNVIATGAQLQSASNPMVCTSSSGSGATYMAACALPLSAYAARQNLFWYADVANSTTTPTLNIDGLGAIALVKQDGSALAANDIKPASLYRIWYDGTNMHVVEAGLGGGTSAPTTPVNSTFAPFGLGMATSTTIPAMITGNNKVWYAQFYVPSPGLTVNNIKSYSGSGGSGGHMALAIYDSTCTKLTDSATVTLSVSTGVVFAFSAYALTPGSYYLGFSSDNAANTLFPALNDNQFAGYLMNVGESSSTYRLFIGGNSSTTTSGVTTLPTTCGTRTALNTIGTFYVPVVYFQ